MVMFEGCFCLEFGNLFRNSSFCIIYMEWIDLLECELDVYGVIIY